MPCSSQILSEVMPEIHTMEKFGFLRSMIYSKIISIPVLKSLFNGPGTARRVILYLFLDSTCLWKLSRLISLLWSFPQKMFITI